MNLLPFALAAALASTSAGAAPAMTGEAIVEWKHEPKDKIIVDQTIWRCAGALCRGEVAEHPASKRRSCRRLAIYAGAVLSFRTASGAFDQQELARCNGRR